MGRLVLPAVLVLLGILMLEGCGQKGALYLPAPNISSPTAVSVPIADQAKPEQNQAEKQKPQTP